MLALTGDGGKKVMNEYFLDNDILYSQPAYMDLLRKRLPTIFAKKIRAVGVYVCFRFRL